MKGPLFYAKILLFGEYGIIKNSKGLSIPYPHYKGSLKIPQTITKDIEKSHQNLKIFLAYLKNNPSKIINFDWEKMQEDVSKKIYFDSSIPQGYGIGSSGALVASVYSKYALDKITVLENLTQEKLKILKDIFSYMEEFFHGTSSGLDPLNSYLSLPILVHSKSQIESTGIPYQNLKGKGAIFLLNSGNSKKTSSMVGIFMENMKNSVFQKMIKKNFITITDTCIHNFLEGNFKSLFTDLKKLSHLVLQNFKPMIPKEYQELWRKGIETNTYYLKLCGSGGGGYILGFTKNFEKTKKIFKNHSLELVYQF